MRSPYQNRPLRYFWKTGVANSSTTVPSEIFQKKWPILPTEQVATAGSCFAQHIGRNLRNSGFLVLDLEPPPKGLSPDDSAKFGYSVYSARYGNIYTTRQLLQLAMEAIGDKRPTDIFWQNETGKFFDALRPGVEPEGLDSAKEVAVHRAYHLEQVLKMFREMDLFIFTMGLTEAWVHKQHGTVYPTAPGTICGSYEAETYEFKNFSVKEIVEDFLAFKKVIQRIRNKAAPAKYLITVSPVPLTATATENHVMVATVYSKSVLRAAAGELSANWEDTDYFPSYEIVMNPWSGVSLYEKNQRSVTAAGVDLVMQTFFTEHRTAKAEVESGEGVSIQTIESEGHSVSSDNAVICEE